MTTETRIYVRDVVGYVPFWVCDESMSKARNRFKRLTGKFPSKKAIITVFSGKFEDLEQIGIDDMGTINYPKTIVKINLQNY